MQFSLLAHMRFLFLLSSPLRHMRHHSAIVALQSYAWCACRVHIKKKAISNFQEHSVKQGAKNSFSLRKTHWKMIILVRFLLNGLLERKVSINSRRNETRKSEQGSIMTEEQLLCVADPFLLEWRSASGTLMCEYDECRGSRRRCPRGRQLKQILKV